MQERDAEPPVAATALAHEREAQASLGETIRLRRFDAPSFL
jgi:hypothetical protein